MTLDRFERAILQGMSESELFLHGNPSDQHPLFLLQLRPWRQVKLPATVVLEPTAERCAKLLRHGFIEPMTAGVGSGDRRFQITKEGRGAVLDLDRRKESI